eukprot:TRINITY_DN555_c0_g1_i4.p1 TRINITY_DN555_c0_g1~~TRINITY_DN555_c0_g1_i4.p1  ORF type:complete len:247 (+),score=68.44 TRINITY_DN555_c0_g1_i4:108-848(+)
MGIVFDKKREMKALAFVALLIVAVSCYNNTTVLFDHFNATFQNLANAIDAAQERNPRLVAISVLRSLRNFKYFLIDLHDTLPTILRTLDNLGYDTLECANAAENTTHSVVRLIHDIRRKRVEHIINDAINVLHSVRETREACNRTWIATVSNLRNTSNPACVEAVTNYVNAAQNLISLPASDRFREYPAVELLGVQAYVACGRQQISRKRINLREVDHKERNIFSKLNTRIRRPFRRGDSHIMTRE